MGIFTIHPKSSAYSSITCSLQEDTALNYQVSPTSLDLNEGERAVAVEGDSRGLNEYSVPIEFDIGVLGSTQAELITNLEVLRRALSDPDGGYIEYRPRGLGSTVLTTWYEYRAAKSPTLALRTRGLDRGVTDAFVKQMNRAGGHAAMVSCSLDTKPLATSDPSNLLTFIGDTTLDNYDDDEHDNSVILYDDNVMGAGVRPIVYMGVTPQGAEGTILMHIKRMRPGAHSRAGWIEPEDYGGAPWPAASEAGISNDGYVQGATTGGYVTFDHPVDSTYVGPTKPILCIRHQPDQSIAIDIDTYVKPGGFSPEIHSIFRGFMPGDNSWYLLFGSREIPWPSWKIPYWITDSSSPSIEDFTGMVNAVGVSWETVEPTTAPLDMDFVYLAAAKDWVGILSDTRINAHSDYRAIFDGITQSGYTIDLGNSDRLFKPGNKRGSPWRDLILYSGWDYRFTFFIMEASDIADGYGKFYHDSVMSVSVKGVYVTVYPFSESAGLMEHVSDTVSTSESVSVSVV